MQSDEHVERVRTVDCGMCFLLKGDKSSAVKKVQSVFDDIVYNSAVERSDSFYFVVLYL
jgi:hypothetical protein